MTREEIKNIVRHVFHFYEVNAENCNWADMNEACGEILKALEQESVTDFADRCQECGKTIKQKYTDEVLDKIRAEIKALSPEPTAYDVVDGNPVKDTIWETLIEVDKIINKYKAESEDKKYEAKVITRGRCMMCGKDLTEGLFFCKECEAKATQGRK